MPSVSPSRATPNEELLAARGLVKSFPGVKALDGVDLTVRAGEIHALMGENGAGKSTLIKDLTGVHPRDAGTLTIAGTPVHARSPREAEVAGISTVYQEVNLIPHLSVAENICLGRMPTRWGLINWSAVHVRCRTALARVGVELDPRQIIAALPLALQQMVAIARAIDVAARVLILDEPTSSLDAREVQALFAVLRRLRQDGLGIIFVTHFLDQVYEVSDRITVLRDGRYIGTWVAADLPRRDLVSQMIGRSYSPPPATPESAANSSTGTQSPAVLIARGLTRRGAIAPLDLALRQGEVVGLAGLLGSGRSETARLLFGVDRADGGSVVIDGRIVTVNSPRVAIRHGLAFLSESRKSDGIAPNLSVRENLILALQARRGALRPLRRTEQEAFVARFTKLLRIKTAGPEQPIGTLSGGNQQKVLIARWLLMEPRLLILDEPTRGIDVGAKAEIAQLIEELRRQGMALLFISSELEEVVRLCSRVLVLRDRACVGELAGSAISEHGILELVARHD